MTLPNDAVYPRHLLVVVAKDGDGLVDNLLLPIGDVESSKGNFVVDQDGWEQILAEFVKRGEIVIDFEHQSVGGQYARNDGRAPAAGWIKALRFDEDVGVIAAVEWNQEARELIKGKEYKYWSPAIRVDKENRKAIELVSAGLTNTPAIYDMPALAAKDGPQENDMDKKTLELKPTEGLRSVLVAFQEDELPQFPAISADQQMVTRLLDLLNEKGAGLEDGATLAEVLGAAIEMLGAADGEEGGGEGEGEAAEAEKALRDELGIDEDGDIMEKVKELKSEQAALVLKAGTADTQAERLAALEAKEAERVKERQEMVLKDLVDRGHLNPNDEKRMSAARLVLTTHGEETLANIYSGLDPIDDPRQLVTGAGNAASGARAKVIALSAKEWEDDRSRGSAKCSTYVNVALDDEGHKVLTAAEVVTLDGKDGE